MAQRDKLLGRKNVEIDIRRLRGRFQLGSEGGSASVHTIHDNVAAEISAIAEATPVPGDWLIGEVALDGNAKKRFDVASLMGGNNLFWFIDGALATGIDIGISYVAGDILTIEAVYIHCKDQGTASSTIVDVNKNGTTIFTTQANRPELAFNDADGIAKSGTPDVTGLVELDVLAIDIDQVATGAGSISVVVVFTGGGGGGGGDSTFTDVYASRPAASNDGDLFLPSDGFVVERDTGAAWVPWGPLFPLTAPPTAGWAWDNQGSATVDTAKGGIYLESLADAGTMRCRYRTAPSPPYKISVAFIPMIAPGALSGYPHLGLCFRQSSDGKLATYDMIAQPTASHVKQQASKWTNSLTWTASYANLSERLVWAGASPIWYRIEDNNVNRICSYSIDGQHWYAFHTVGRTDFLTADQVGFYLAPNGTSGNIAMNLLSWKEE